MEDVRDGYGDFETAGSCKVFVAHRAVASRSRCSAMALDCAAWLSIARVAACKKQHTKPCELSDAASGTSRNRLCWSRALLCQTDSCVQMHLKIVCRVVFVTHLRSFKLSSHPRNLDSLAPCMALPVDGGARTGGDLGAINPFDRRGQLRLF